MTSSTRVKDAEVGYLSTVCFYREKEKARGVGEINRWIDRPIKGF